MNKLFSTLLLLLFLSLTACSDKQSETDKGQKKVFDLVSIKKQYANTELEIADISEQSYQNGAALAVTFSVPLNPKQNFQDFFKVSDKKGQIFNGNWIISSNGLVAYFPEIEPSTTYIIDVFKDLTAATDAKLKQAVNKKITTRKMPAQVSFASQGSILPAKLAKGLPVISVNINEVDVDFHRIKPDKINHFISSWTNNSGRSSQRYYDLQEYSTYTELVYSGRFSLNPPKNTRHTTHLNLNAIDKIQQPGIYLAVMKPAGTYEYEKQVSYFTVSDIGLHIRTYPDRMDVQVSSLRSGNAISEVSLSLVDSKDNILAQKSSDPQGQASFISPSHKAQLLIARNKNNIALLKLNTPALDLSEFKVTGRSYKPIEIFTYGPRDLYRPGETVKINALLRDADGQNLTEPPPLSAVILRPDGQKIKFFTLYANKNLQTQGIYQTEYSLPANAATGQWTLELKTTNKNKHLYHFQVEAFLPERMELLLGDQAVQENWTNSKDTLNIPVSGQYLYGAPAANNRLSTKVIIKPDRHPIKSRQQYFFGLADEKPPIEYFEQDDIKLDKQGLASMKIPSRWQAIKNSPFAIKVIGSLYETGGRPVTRSINYHLWPQPNLLGIRPQLNLKSIPADTQVTFDIIKSNSEGSLQGETEVLATLIKEGRNYYWEYSSTEGWHYEFTERNFKSFEQRIKLNNKQPSTITVPVDWGSYLLKVKDTETGQISSLRFQAGYGWHKEQSNTAARPDRVVLKLDKKNYQAGETAMLQIVPPYAGNAFVMVENSDKPLWFQRVSIPAEGLNLSIPVDKSWNRHDLYISTIIFRPGDAKEKITPNRAIGLIHLPLNRSDRQLTVDIEAPTSVIRPEKTLSTAVKISGFSPDKETYVTLAAVDVGVLNITDFKTPDPHQWFFKPRRYAVDQRDIYNKIIELTDGTLIKPRFGGDADKHAGGARPDSSVKIISLFSGIVKADENGVAIVKHELPDFNGRLRLMAVAFNQNQFGSAEADITVAAPIIAESSLPRFLASGDKSTMTLDVRNQSGKTQSLSIVVSASSPVSLNSKPLSLVLKDKEKKVFQFPITAKQAFGQSQIDLSLNNDETSSEPIKINRQWHLGVRPAYPAINTVQRKIVAAGESIEIKPALEDMVVASAHSHLLISTQPPINIKQHVKSLLRYPYGCLEQTISSTYPWLAINQQNLISLGLNKIRINNKAIDLTKKPLYIEKSLNTLSGMQRSNGSFGLWSNKDQEEHWLTAYAADFLLDAKEKSYLVPEELLNKTLQRLTQYLNNRGNMYGERYSQAPGHYSFSYKAFAAYVLSRVNRAPLGSLRTLYDHHKDEVKSALPLTHLGLALYIQGDKIRGIKAIKESLSKPRDNTIYLSDYGSRLRDISVMTYLLGKHNIQIPGSENLIFQLSDELNNRQYLSTQERNALFRAGLQLQTESKTELQGTLILQNTAIKLKQKQTYRSQYIGKEIPANIKFSSSPELNHPLYLEFSLNAYPTKVPEMQMDNIKVERNYYDLEGHVIKPEQHKTGDVLLVHLTIRADKRIKDSLVIDLIPAGFELENQNLSNNIKIDSFKIGNETIETMQYYNQVKYQEYLDDRFIAAIDLHKNRPEHLFYLIRAVTKGTYTNPPPYVEDMYRPYIRAIGREFKNIEIK